MAWFKRKLREYGYGQQKIFTRIMKEFLAAEGKLEEMFRELWLNSQTFLSDPKMAYFFIQWI